MYYNYIYSDYDYILRLIGEYHMLLNKKDIMKIIKSVSQKLREEGGDAAKIVPQLEVFKEKYIEILSQPFKLSLSEVEVLENAYSNIPEEVITRKIKENAAEQLHKVMTTDLNDLYTIQLKNNVKSIKDDKQHLDTALAALDKLSASLVDSIRFPECRRTKRWRGAELHIIGINESSSKEDDSSWVVVKTKRPIELSYVVSEAYKISGHFMDHMSKYVFFEKLGNTANDYVGDDEIGLYQNVIETAKNTITEMHGIYVKNLHERVAARNIEARMFG